MLAELAFSSVGSLYIVPMYLAMLVLAHHIRVLLRDVAGDVISNFSRARLLQLLG